jgi:hypothetical protein
MNIEIILSIIGGLYATFKWIYEYSENLKWNRNKFMLDEIDKFRSIQTTKSVEKILDWNGINVEVYGTEIYVNDEILFEALQTHDVKQKFSKDEVLLRNLFDEYFDNLTKLIYMCETKMISSNNFKLFMSYWLDILSSKNKNKPKKVHDQILRYLEYYRFFTLKNYLIK